MFWFNKWCFYEYHILRWLTCLDPSHVSPGWDDDNGGEQGAHDADCGGDEAENDTGGQRRLQQVQGMEGNNTHLFSNFISAKKRKHAGLFLPGGFPIRNQSTFLKQKMRLVPTRPNSSSGFRGVRTNIPPSGIRPLPIKRLAV